MEAVDWLYDRERSSPKQPVYSKGIVYVLMRLSIGNISFTVDIQLYLRRATVRKLNRKRGKKLSFRSKMIIAKEMLRAIAPLLPKGYQVYVLFDSWYASAKFIKWCRKQKWHVICRLKSNRQLDRIPVKQHNKRLKHRRYKTVSVPAADDEQPRYYGSTDTSLSLEETLSFFGKRWSCEVANWYITEKLGWADCRLWRFESTDKFLMVLWLALAYLEMSCVQSERCQNLVDVIRQHRNNHARRLLEAACQLAQQVSDLSQVLEQFTIAA